jgi:hypothetical protein
MVAKLPYAMLATLLLVVTGGGTAQAGYCGAASYDSCSASCAAPCGDYHVGRRCCQKSIKVPCVTWEQQTCMVTKTVYDGADSGLLHQNGVRHLLP